MAKKQIQFPVPISEDGFIIIPACRLTREQARHFESVLVKLNCNIAKFIPSGKLQSYWDSVKDSQCVTVTVDRKAIASLQQLANIGDNLEQSVIELINFYESKKNLNLILQSDVIEERPSYADFTSQFAHTLSRAQNDYPYIRVLFDPTTSQLGIFCRKTKDATTFHSHLISQLRKHHSLKIEQEDLPQTYKTNFPMLKQAMKKHLTDKEELVFLQDQKNSVTYIDLIQKTS